MNLCSQIGKLSSDDFAELMGLMEVVPKAVMSEVKAEAVEKALKARSMEEEEGRSSDVDGLVSESGNTVVSPAALDCNDAQVLGEALMSSLAARSCLLVRSPLSYSAT